MAKNNDTDNKTILLDDIVHEVFVSEDNMANERYTKKQIRATVLMFIEEFKNAYGGLEEGDKIQFRGLGNFYLKYIPSKKVNATILDGKEVDIGDYYRLLFSASGALKDNINNAKK